jgi:hypothetical protein
MYRALKDAQSEINTTLLKLVDDISGVTENRTAMAKSEAGTAKSEAGTTTTPDPYLQELSNSLGFIHQKQSIQFGLIVEELKSMRSAMDSILKFMVTREIINTDTTIPVIQQTSQDSDLKQVFVTTPESPKEEVSEAPEASEAEV